MDIVLIVARLVLAVVFIVAGLAKLADLAGSREALRSFGIPVSFAVPLGVMLPLAELAVAALLIPTATAWLGALGAFTLLLSFIVGISINLARGKRPDCHCFGQLHSSPAGWPTLIRNGSLAALASVIIWQGRDAPGPSVIAWTYGLTTADRVLAGVAIFALLVATIGGWILFHLVGQNGRLLLRLEALEATATGRAPRDGTAAVATAPGLTVGTPAPAFDLPGLHGETVGLETLRSAGKPVVLIFSDPMCGPCNALLPEIGHWQRQYAATMTIAVVTGGGMKANLTKYTEHGLTQVLLQQDREVAKTFQVQGTPTAVLVRPDGTIGSLPALGPDEIRSLVALTASTDDPATANFLRRVASPVGSVNGTHNSHDRLAPNPVASWRDTSFRTHWRSSSWRRHSG